jgi:hypothetical protein
VDSTPVNVLVVFYSRFGRAEQLALAAGVGAIQAKGNIRLRRLADLADAKTIAASVEWTENLARMNRDYVTPRPADIEWADVVVLAAPADSSSEVVGYISSIAPTVRLTQKIAAPLVPGNAERPLESICAACGGAGFVIESARLDPADAVTSARTFGQRVTELARKGKTRN